LRTNLIIILIITKEKELKMDCMGISSYYETVPRGEKDEFIRAVADAIGQSTSNVRLKMRNGRWSQLELSAIEDVISERRA
jgi:hypothetical protein